MVLKRLQCAHFRCLKDVDLAPEASVNIIFGENAQGKTSLLESLLYVATARSHRTSLDSELVEYGKEGFRIAAWVEKQPRPVVVEAAWFHGTKRFRVNGITQSRISDILGKINVVTFFAEDVALIRGPAQQRRRLMDIELSKVNREYLQALQSYRQVLRQRNELLRRSTVRENELISWDIQLSRYATILMLEREAFIQQLAVSAEHYYRKISGEQETLRMIYKPDISPDIGIQETIAAAHSYDMKQRTTSRGPHRDDIEIIINEKNARQFGSQGQHRCVALAIKLAITQWVFEMTREYPILTLDDVFSELDLNRSRRLLSLIPENIQCFITCTPQYLEVFESKGYKFFHVKEGHVEEK